MSPPTAALITFGPSCQFHTRPRTLWFFLPDTLFKHPTVRSHTLPYKLPFPPFILALYSRLAESSRAPSHLSCGWGREAEPMLDFCGFSLWSGWFIFLFPPQSSPHLADFLAWPLKLYFCRFYSAALVWLMSNTHRGTESLGALAQNEDGAWDVFSLIYVGLCAQHHHNGMKLNLRT